MRRVQSEPAFVLHRYDWSETSLILEVFSHQHGRLALMAKGAKRPSSQLRPVLLPLQPLLLSWSGEAEVRTLKSAEWAGAHIMPQGERLLLGVYLNELLLKCLAREDPYPALFAAYRRVVALLAQPDWLDAESALRAFELLLLRELGFLPALHCETHSLHPLLDDQAYALTPTTGLSVQLEAPEGALDAQAWRALQHSLNQQDWAALIGLCSLHNGALKSQLRVLLHHHCHLPTLQTRQMMRALRAFTFNESAS